MTQTNIIQIKEQKHYFIIWLKLYSNLFFLISQKCLSFCLVLALAFMKSKLFLRSYSQAGWVDKNITTFSWKSLIFLSCITAPHHSSTCDFRVWEFEFWGFFSLCVHICPIRPVICIRHLPLKALHLSYRLWLNFLFL